MTTIWLWIIGGLLISLVVTGGLCLGLYAVVCALDWIHARSRKS